MADIATPNLPSRKFDRTVEFYGGLGFSPVFRDEGWLILARGDILLEFFSFPDLEPTESSFGCCLRLDDVDAFHRECLNAGIEEKSHGFPRVHAPRREASGLRIGALLDPDGTLLRLVQNPT
ncbi:bleomycin resistance protein [Granulicoccus sp. GXG6511]|uniref:bleomycin resistance protein n=1 Tax=Granulicoccus sp. GXG6511 TaxID=3381351 RepID=UPI003D7E1903